MDDTFKTVQELARREGVELVSADEKCR